MASGDDVDEVMSGIVYKKHQISKNIENGKLIARCMHVGDIDLEDAQLNLHTVKQITGNDSVSVPPVKVRTRCSLVAASNDLPHPLTQKTWCSQAISRRMMFAPMNVKTSLIPVAERPDSAEDCIGFILSCVNVYLTNTYSPPISTRSLMYSMLGAGYAEIEDAVQFDESASEQDIIDANTSIELHFKLELHSLGELAHAVCPAMTIESGSAYMINNLRMSRSL